MSFKKCQKCPQLITKRKCQKNLYYSYVTMSVQQSVINYWNFPSLPVYTANVSVALLHFLCTVYSIQEPVKNARCLGWDKTLHVWYWTEFPSINPGKQCAVQCAQDTWGRIEGSLCVHVMGTHGAWLTSEQVHTEKIEPKFEKVLNSRWKNNSGLFFLRILVEKSESRKHQLRG